MHYQDRKKRKILQHINTSSPGLEIGPLCWPILNKSEANVKYVDHVSTERLIGLYAHDKGVPSDLIVNVDYALNMRSLKQTVGKKKFSYIIASHVIEHVPDTIDWLNDLSEVLEENGILALIIPDKRYTFDIDRNVSSLADLISLHKQTNRAPLLDYLLHRRLNVNPFDVWEGNRVATKPMYDTASAMELLNDSISGKYIDAHWTVYTPYSFVNVCRDLIELDLFNYKFNKLYNTEKYQYEFIVILEKNTIKAEQRKSIPKIPKDLTILDLEKEITSLVDKNNLTNSMLEDYKKELKRTINSRSWRITKPLRQIAHTIRNF